MSEIYSNFSSLRRSPWLKFKLFPFLSAAVILCSVTVNAVEAKSSLALQELTVSGQVLDDANKPMPGVNIVVKGTTNGTTTDTDGKYSVTVPTGNAVLVFSFIGYVTQEIDVSSRPVVNISLK